MALHSEKCKNMENIQLNHKVIHEETIKNFCTFLCDKIQHIIQKHEQGREYPCNACLLSWKIIQSDGNLRHICGFLMLYRPYCLFSVQLSQILLPLKKRKPITYLCG